MFKTVVVRLIFGMMLVVTLIASFTGMAVKPYQYFCFGVGLALYGMGSWCYRWEAKDWNKLNQHSGIKRMIVGATIYLSSFVLRFVGSF